MPAGLRSISERAIGSPASAGIGTDISPDNVTRTPIPTKPYSPDSFAEMSS